MGARVTCCLLASFAASSTLAPSICSAQAVHVASVDALRKSLAPGDVVTVVSESGEPIRGRLTRIDDMTLELQPLDARRAGTIPRDVTLPLAAIATLERPRDSVRDGTLWGMGIGAGTGAGLFIYALAIDRNEIDEWAPGYAVGAAALTGLGALIGWRIDASRSKPHIVYRSSPDTAIAIGLRPAASAGPGVALTVTFSP